MTASALVGASIAHAEPTSQEEVRPDPGAPVEHVPGACQEFAASAAGAHKTLYEWRQALSFASCMQDASVLPASDADEVRAMVSALESRIAPGLRAEFAALQHGPDSVQLQAAFQIGMAELGLVIRARSGLEPTADLDHDQQLRDVLEPLVAPALQTARMAFWSIDRAATDDPRLASDAVAANMIDNARALLAMLPAPTKKDELQQAPAPTTSQN